MSQTTNSQLSNTGALLLTESELAVQANSSRQPRLPTLRMSRPEKGVLLQFFIEQELHVKKREERDKAFEEAVEVLCENNFCRTRTKSVVSMRHIQKYFSDFSPPLCDDGKAMPYEKDDDGKVVIGVDGKPNLYEDVISRQDEASKGTKNYWLNLVKLDAIMCSSMTTTMQSPQNYLQQLSREPERRNEHAKRLHTIDKCDAVGKTIHKIPHAPSLLLVRPSNLRKWICI